MPTRSAPLVAAALAALLLTGCTTTTVGPGLADGRTTASDAVLDDALDPAEPGCAAAVAREGALVWEHAVGVADVETGEPITTSTVFDFASVSKQFTGVAVLLLAQRGALSLDDSLSAWVDGLPAWADDVTIADLLHHTSGIPDYLDLLDAEYEDSTDQADAVAAIAGVAELGDRAFTYSNSNYVLLAEVVAAASGESLPDALAEEVFRRLGLDLAMDPEFASDDLATSYSRVGDGFEAQSSGWTQVGDGGIHGTARDLALWGDNYRTGAVGGPELLAAQLDAAPTGDGSGYGAGIEVFDDGTIGHTGGWLGFSSAFTVSTDRLTSVAVTCNLEEIDAESLASQLLALWS